MSACGRVRGEAAESASRHRPWSVVMRFALVSASIAALLATATLAAQDHPNLSGTWVLNRAKSTVTAEGRLAQPGEGEAQNLVIDIEQTAGEVTITRRGGAADPIVLPFDGRESQAKGPRGGLVTSRSRWEGKVLVTESSREVTGPKGAYTVTSRDERTLDADGRTLTLKSVSRTPRGEAVRTLVFDRRDPPSH
jgi:hypothetical protein